MKIKRLILVFLNFKKASQPSFQKKPANPKITKELEILVWTENVIILEKWSEKISQIVRKKAEKQGKLV